MGRRVTEAPVLTLAARVSGTQPIEFVDVVKNGELVFRKSDQRPPAIASRVWLQVWFESSTEVLNGQCDPRGARPWKGSLTVEGARLLGWTDPWFAHPDSYRVVRPDPAANRLDFQLLTRGRGTAILLELDGATAATRVAVRLDEVTESPGDPEHRDRPAAKLPGRGARNRGGRPREAGRSSASSRSYATSIACDRGSSLREAPSTSISSIGTPRHRGEATRTSAHGQIDGAMAWSSPWWVEIATRKKSKAVAYETLLVDRSERIATITLNRPQALNAVTATMTAELTEVIDRCARDAEPAC